MREDEISQKKSSSLNFWDLFPYWNKLVRVVPLVFKISKHWLPSTERNQSTFQARIFSDDLVKSRYFILKRVQQDKFERELTLINQNLPSHNSKNLPLQPFIKNELLHVGVRLKHSSLKQVLSFLVAIPSFLLLASSLE